METPNGAPKGLSGAPNGRPDEPARSDVCIRTGTNRCELGLPVEDCETLRDRLVWLVEVRWHIIAAAAAAVAIGAVSFPGAAYWSVLAGLVGLLAASNVAWVRASRGGPAVLCGHVLQFSLAQMLIDFALLGAAVHFTGGIHGPLAPLFVLHGVFSAVLLPFRYTLGILSATVVLLFASATLQGAWIPRWAFGDPRFSPQWVSTLLHFGCLFLAAVGAGAMGLYLSRQLRERHLRIERLAGELAKLNSDLRAVDEQRVRLLGVASHDLRSPLAAIESRLDILKDGYMGPMTDAQREQIAKIKVRLCELRSFVNDLLDLTAVETAGARAPDLRSVDVFDQVRRTIAELAPLAQRSGASIDEHFPDSPGFALAPPDRLALVWQNLVSNAIKYGGGKPVSVHGERLDGRVVIRVEDRGMGIADDERDRMFTEFHRSRAARESAIPGSGLGLAIAKRILDAVGATIEFDSAPGKGTTFTVSLPAAEPPAPETGRQET